MEKLIELLNEYQKENKRQIFYSYNRNIDFFESWSIAWWQTYWESLYTIISKKFWFIQRLVDNDKIDFRKLEDNSDWYWIELWDDCYEVLALLSIQDNPIEFLISILKDKKVRTVYVDEDWNVSWDTKLYSDC